MPAQWTHSARQRRKSWPPMKVRNPEWGYLMKLDKSGRRRVHVPRMGPGAFFLRSCRLNPVIVSHTSDWVTTIEQYMTRNPKCFAINTTGDGCADLTSSRIVNMLVWFRKVEPLIKKYNWLFLCFSQYWPEDSPSNPIERQWAFICRSLCNLHGDQRLCGG